MSNPYISITDFTHADQVRRMLGVLNAECTDRLLGVGVMMSYKTLNGLETKWSKAFPPKEKIREIFLQVAIYAGVPAGVDSFRIAREAFAEVEKGA